MLTKKTGNNYICECGSLFLDHYIELEYDNEWDKLRELVTNRDNERIISKDCPKLFEFTIVLHQTDHLVLVEKTNVF